MATEEPYADLISEEIKRLEAVDQRGGLRLRFSARLERQFQDYYAKTFRNYRRASMMIALLVIGAVGLLDVVVFGEYWKTIALVRYGLGVPFVTIAGVLVFSKYYERLQQQIITQCCLFISFTATVLLLVGPDSAYPLYLSAYLLLALFAGTIARLAFRRAAMVMLLTFIGFNCLILWWRPQPIEVIASYNAYFACCALMALAANFYMEMSIRREFVHSKLIRLERSQLKDVNQQLQHMATIDPLTGVNNRRQLEKSLDAEWRRASRNNKQLSLLMVDIDAFKKYNDGYGHQAGDNCLERVAKCIDSSFKRSADSVARYGGEEFVVLLPETGAEQAEQLAESLCENVRNLGIQHEYSEAADVVTLSVGVVTCEPDMNGNFEKMVHWADLALYEAKESGRNRYVIYSAERHGIS